MKRIFSVAALALGALVISPRAAETPATKDDQALLALVQDVQAQQARITENQGKIDEKMTEVLELVRVARIFAGRGGK